MNCQDAWDSGRPSRDSKAPINQGSSFQIHTTLFYFDGVKRLPYFRGPRHEYCTDQVHKNEADLPACLVAA